MVNKGRILIADDEETFLYSTADLFRREGYDCYCAQDAASASEMLRNNKYDLLVSDIKMPGNCELEFIRELSGIAEGVPVILVTGYPSLDSAIQSIQLPVIAYMVKPIDFDHLLAKAQESIAQSRIYHIVCDLQQRLQNIHERLMDIQGVFTGKPRCASSTPVDVFLGLTFHNIIGALSDLMHLTKSFTRHKIEQEACHLLDCPKLIRLMRAIEDTIDVLEKTKSSFKSKELGELRQNLERIVKDIGNV